MVFVLYPPYDHLALSIWECPKRLFKQKTLAVRISLRNFHPLSLSVIDFSPAAHTSFVRVVRPEGLGEKEGFLRIRTVKLGRSRILRSLYSNDLRNQRVKTDERL
ncbi:hypothetical protein AVEN_110020-1 [Araneus ventricosus]|uniref:Uncharacterized protein n=1 Tax=Araneus ventricosus TaxID=182803 RepID=A0A4Y2H2Q7_ARAVE|nr:hypothetical protein AVEN_110020-1 [Araneus ventricosus]